MTFGDLTVRFDQRVLRPRPWTLAQSLWAAALAQHLPKGPILELCAGVGHIGLHLASLVRRDLTQIDADAIACEHARLNAATANLDVQVDVRHGLIDQVVQPQEQFTLILADPPWVATADTGNYPFDPLSAIDGGYDGLDLARTCLQVMDRHLCQGGAGVLQLGTTEQAAQVETYLATQTQLKLRLVAVRAIPGANGVLTHLTR
ncbi:MAG: methyltransferase [Nitriliruptoraceae bacterium]